METPLTDICLPLSYCMRCMTWNGVKTRMKKGGDPIEIRHFWAKYKSAFDDMRSRNDFHYAGSNRIACDDGYTYCEYFDREKKEYVYQDLADMLIHTLEQNAFKPLLSRLEFDDILPEFKVIFQKQRPDLFEQVDWNIYRDIYQALRTREVATSKYSILISEH